MHSDFDLIGVQSKASFVFVCYLIDVLNRERVPDQVGLFLVATRLLVRLMVTLCVVSIHILIKE